MNERSDTVHTTPNINPHHSTTLSIPLVPPSSTLNTSDTNHPTLATNEATTLNHIHNTPPAPPNCTSVLTIPSHRQTPTTNFHRISPTPLRSGQCHLIAHQIPKFPSHLPHSSSPSKRPLPIFYSLVHRLLLTPIFDQSLNPDKSVPHAAVLDLSNVIWSTHEDSKHPISKFRNE